MSQTYSLLADRYEAMMDDVLYALYIDLIERFTTPSSLLEIGCGTGTIARACAHKGYTVHAFDEDETMIELGHHYAVSEGVNIQFFIHDMTQPFQGEYDTIIIPIDVLNHAQSIDAVHQTLNAAKQALSDEGILIFDLLKESYMEMLDGHYETITSEKEVFTWKVEQVASQKAIKHSVTRRGQTQSHFEYYYSLKAVLQQLSGFEVLEKVPLESRDIVVLKRKK